MTDTRPSAIPAVPALLGYSGVLPFAALAIAVVLTDGAWQNLALRAFLAYGAVILSFLGGIRWGAAARAAQPRNGEYVLAVLPSLWAWACLLAEQPMLAAWGLMAGFALMGFADWLRPAPGTASWLVTLRLRLTAAVVLCHAIVIVAV
ncbi:MAG: DUF3429 domain-containing protein [Xanthomonadales bacterium]